MRQLIIARKDLNMSPGKLAAQVSHASMVFITRQIRDEACKVWKYRSYPSFRTDSVTGEKRQRLYKHPDLCLYAMEAFNMGQDYFTVRPKDSEMPNSGYELCENDYDKYSVKLSFPRDVYEDWFAGSFTKTVCEAKNRNQLMKSVTIAEELGLKEDSDFFMIKDNCLTELEPEEVDENGVGRTLTCIGFRPLPDDVAHQISRKYQLYR